MMRYNSIFDSIEYKITEEQIINNTLTIYNITKLLDGRNELWAQYNENQNILESVKQNERYKLYNLVFQ